MDIAEATFLTPRRELLGIPEGITGKGVRIAIVDAFVPAHPDVAARGGRNDWLDCEGAAFDPAEVMRAYPGWGQHGLRAAVAAGVSPGCDLVGLNQRIRAGQRVKDAPAAEVMVDTLAEKLLALGVRAIIFGTAGRRTGPLVPWQRDRQRRICERLSAMGMLVFAGTGNCPGSFSPTSLAPSALAGGGIALPDAPGEPILPFHGPEGVSFEGKVVPECRAPAERVVFPNIDGDAECGVPGVPRGYTVQDGTSMADPFMLGLLACVWEKYPNLDAQTMRHAVAAAAGKANPRFGCPPVGMPTWDGMVEAIASLDGASAEEPSPWELYSQVQEMPWPERMAAVRSRPDQSAEILLNSLPQAAPGEYAEELASLFHERPDAKTRAVIVLLLASADDGAPAGSVLDEALGDEAILVVGCALDRLRRFPSLADARTRRLTELINHDDGQVRCEALLAAKGGNGEELVEPTIHGMQRDLEEGPLRAFFDRRLLLKQITGETCWPETRKMLPGECVYSEYWLGKQAQCANNWAKWLRDR